jgi:hypothetical protein
MLPLPMLDFVLLYQDPDLDFFRLGGDLTHAH